MRPRPPSLAALTLILALVLAPVPGAHARSPHLWATVNLCDTASSPNTIGIRASMPGNGRRQRMYMRFEAQFFDRTRNRFVRTGSSSRWIGAGSARFRAAQRGYSFQFAPPPAGEQFVMRGRVDFRWRARRGRRGHRRWKTVLKRTRYTKAGYLGVRGGDPPGRSEEFCIIR